VLSRLASTHPLVAVVSGRPVAQLAERVYAPGLTLVGVYGLPETGPRRAQVERAQADVERIAGLVPGAWVEDKGPSLAVHYRAAHDPARATTVLSAALRPVAEAYALSLLTGKMVLELAAGPVPGKGEVVRELLRSTGVHGCLYAGDDTADLDAFSALDQLESTASVKVAVRSEETPAELISAADVVVERPGGLVELLSAM
jgi:trehalose 6-phosphate phosphatase